MPDKSLSTAIKGSKIPRFEAELLLSHILGKDRVWILAHGDHKLTSKQHRSFELLARRRCAHEPIAHLVGKKEFYGREFIVTKDTLIPRPETELTIDLGKNLPGKIIWDVGTGSGAIAVTLAKELPGVKALATDVSTKALTVAKKNAKKLGAAKHITFLKSNLLQPAAYRWLQKHGKQKSVSLLICANLPYLPTSDKKKLALDVTKFEPATALYSGTDGLQLITRFLRQLARHLSEWNYTHVTLLFEFDPPQAQKIVKLSNALFPDFTCTLHRDLAGKNRVLRIQIDLV